MPKVQTLPQSSKIELSPEELLKEENRRLRSKVLELQKELISIYSEGSNIKSKAALVVSFRKEVSNE